MPTQEDAIFAKVAVQNKLLSQEQAAMCLKATEPASPDGRAVPLSEIVVTRKLLSQEHVNTVILLVQYTIARMRDKTYASLLLDRQLVAKADIDAAFEHQQQFFKQSKQSVSIIETLVNRGLLKVEKAAEVLRDAQKPPPVAAKAEEPPPPPSKAELFTFGEGKCKAVIKVMSLPTGRRVSCIAVAGQLDTTSFYEFDKVIRQIVTRPGDEGKYLIINLENVTYMSSAGVGVIANAKKSVDDRHGSLQLAAVPKKLQDILSLVGLDIIVGFHTMEKAAKLIQDA